MLQSSTRTAWRLAVPVFTLAVGGAGGAVATAAHLPLGWLLGALVGAALVCCVYEKAHIPQPWRYSGQLVIGLSAGFAFTPRLLQHVASLLPVMVLAVFGSIATGLACSRLLIVLAKTDPATAYFASVPGGVAEMANLADRHGGEVAPVAVAQTLRIFFAVLTIPLLVRVLGRPEASAALAAVQPLALAYIAPSLAAASLAGWLPARRHIPNAWLLGGLAVGVAIAACTGADFKLPAPVLSIAQVLIGASLGARLRRRTLLREARVALISICATSILLAGTIAMGLALSWQAHVGLTTAILGTSPGGLAEMGLTAIALHADVGLVVAFHFVRTLLVATLSVPIYLAARRLRGRTARAGRRVASSGRASPDGASPARVDDSRRRHLTGPEPGSRRAPPAS